MRSAIPDFGQKFVQPNRKCPVQRRQVAGTGHFYAFFAAERVISVE